MNALEIKLKERDWNWRIFWRILQLEDPTIGGSYNWRILQFMILKMRLDSLLKKGHTVVKTVEPPHRTSFPSHHPPEVKIEICAFSHTRGLTLISG